jgi:stearoyl-CoA desaturase (delta-9 desaturase)
VSRPPLSAWKLAAHLTVLVVPFAGVAVAAILLWNRAVTAWDLVLLLGMYLLVAPGITVGFHRLLAHRAFATYPVVEYALAALGSMAMQGSVVDWVADHRVHHGHADRPGDPHSPHGHDGSTLRALWHAHAGWLFRHQGRADHRRHAPELLEDRVMRAIDLAFIPLVVLSLAIPFAAGWALSGTLHGGLTGLVWGGLVRLFLFHHVIFSVNSLGHFFGGRRFETADRSTNVAWLALASLGESWHHNHHAFPRSALHGLRWYELDVSGLLIRLLERVGLAWNVVRISPERQAQKLAAPAGTLAA